MGSWYDDEAFWRDAAPAIFNEERRKSAASEVDQVISLVSLAPGAAVLDLGCGQGRHSLEFARRGYAVTGVDRTASYIDAAKETALRESLEIEFVHADIREFRRENRFDLAVSMLTSFGYFEEEADERRALENARASLRPGGRLVIDLMGKEVLARIFRERDWHREPDGTVLLEERKVVDDWRWLEVRWIVQRGMGEGSGGGAVQTSELPFRLRLYSASDLKQLLASVGFSDVQAFGSLRRTPYDHAAERLVAVGKREIASSPRAARRLAHYPS